MSAATLAELEALSRSRPDRVLRLRGTLPVAHSGDRATAAGAAREPFELLIFRGFASSVSHPTAFDPDQPALPAEARLVSAELLQAPLDPRAERLLAGPLPAEALLDPAAWL
ncbi:MAG: hypothetical protein DCF24_09930 [Cyanobium sp.]|nr:MAG: hypothetical protein DCF24_09930 [Cyanobium sp.]PZV04158.1 MAG: hypothetical protein DCF23_06945 [Cyanobium sp.]